MEGEDERREEGICEESWAKSLGSSSTARASSRALRRRVTEERPGRRRQKSSSPPSCHSFTLRPYIWKVFKDSIKIQTIDSLLATFNTVSVVDYLPKPPLHAGLLLTTPLHCAGLDALKWKIMDEVEWSTMVWDMVDPVLSWMIHDSPGWSMMILIIMMVKV